MKTQAILMIALLACASAYASPLATGGTETNVSINGSNYTVHTFTTNETFTVLQTITNASFCLMGGGGAGGTSNSGGGGAGGVNCTWGTTLSPMDYTVTIGGKGVAGTGGFVTGGRGGNTSFNGSVGLGGGGGGSLTTDCTTGGSGGGAGHRQTTQCEGGTQGKAGGKGAGSDTSPYTGGGGGGAGTNGTNWNVANGAGGNGTYLDINGSNTSWCMGGGAGGNSAAGVGGTPWGGNGSTGHAGNAAGFCSGGGGGGNSGSSNGGNGSAGIVIIRYPAYVPVTNTLVQMQNATIQPASTNISGTITCNGTATTNGTTQLVIHTSILLNGTNQTALATSTNVNNNTNTQTASIANPVKGNNWMCVLRALDTYNTSTTMNTTNTTTINTAPTNTTLTFANSTNRSLWFTASLSCDDADGAADMNATYITTSSGNCSYLSNTTSGNRLNTTYNCSNNESTAATVSMTCEDKSLANASASGSNHYPTDSAPTMVSVAITPISPTYLNTLTCTPNATDAEGDALTYTYQWFNQVGIIPTATTNTLPPQNPFDMIVCSVYATDNTTKVSDTMNSSTVTLLDTAAPTPARILAIFWASYGAIILVCAALIVASRVPDLPTQSATIGAGFLAAFTLFQTEQWLFWLGALLMTIAAALKLVI